MNKLMICSKPFNTILRCAYSRNVADAAEVLNITNNCVKRLREIASEGDNLRIVVEGGGCAGFQYKFELDSQIADDDKIFEKDNVKIVIDPDSFAYVKGSTIDYEVQLIRSSFKIVQNPLAEEGCSCGASFSVRKE